MYSKIARIIKPLIMLAFLASLPETFAYGSHEGSQGYWMMLLTRWMVHFAFGVFLSFDDVVAVLSRKEKMANPPVIGMAVLAAVINALCILSLAVTLPEFFRSVIAFFRWRGSMMYAAILLGALLPKTWVIKAQDD